MPSRWVFMQTDASAFWARVSVLTLCTLPSVRTCDGRRAPSHALSLNTHALLYVQAQTKRAPLIGETVTWHEDLVL